jgi:hypothetical protein
VKTFSFVLFLLISPVSASSAEQRVVTQCVVTIYTEATWGGSAPSLEADCKELCFVNGNIKDWLSIGWRIIESHHAEVEQRPFKSDSGWCRCTGEEYVLER